MSFISSDFNGLLFIDFLISIFAIFSFITLLQRFTFYCNTIGGVGRGVGGGGGVGCPTPVTEVLYKNVGGFMSRSIRKCPVLNPDASGRSSVYRDARV